MTKMFEAVAGKRGWIISGGKTDNEVQARGVLDAVPLAYEFKRVAPSGLCHGPWGPVNPTERFGPPQSQFHPPWPDFAVPIGRLTMALVREATAGSRRLLCDGAGSSPNPAFLAHADAFIAPTEPVNMTGEPCPRASPCTCSHPLVDRLSSCASMRPTTAMVPPVRCLIPLKRLESWSYAPLSSADTIAAEIVRRWPKCSQMSGVRPPVHASEA
jgi:mitochondrial fission protein ELM1